MPTIGLFKIDPASAADPVVIEERICATLSAGERLITFDGCDYGVVSEIVCRLRGQGKTVIGFQQKGGPPEYFIKGCSSMPVVRDDTVKGHFEPGLVPNDGLT